MLRAAIRGTIDFYEKEFGVMMSEVMRRAGQRSVCEPARVVHVPTHSLQNSLPEPARERRGFGGDVVELRFPITARPELTPLHFWRREVGAQEAPETWDLNLCLLNTFKLEFPGCPVMFGGGGGDGPRGPGDPRFECILLRFQIRGLRDPVGPFRERGVGAPEAPETLDLNLFC